VQHGASAFVVDCDLGLQHFDSPRVAASMARAAYGEVRRLGRRDERVRATEWTRRDRDTVRVTVTVDAPDARAAYEVASGLLRTGIHTIGGSTAGWETLRPDWQVRHDPGHRTVGAERLAPPPTWATRTAAARRRLESLPQLPPLSAVTRHATGHASGMPSVIDLR
jgi:hypothetical protein